MNEQADQIAVNVLSFLAVTGGQLDAFRAQLKQSADLSATSFVECRYYGSEVYVCVCLEAEVAQDKVLTWWLDIVPKPGGWLIEASVLWNGRELVAQVPSQTVPNFHAVQTEVPRTLRHLLDAGGAALAQARAKTPPQSDELHTRALD